MNAKFYEIINIWIESKSEDLNVHDISDTHIQELEGKLKHAGLL